ncbi:MAG: hypothetical protein HY552_04510 [Elusimicrobia bacterium]|nr:hypothetical protein [Elusimicrobiota bacterium]
MKSLERGGFQHNPLMRATLAWTLLFAAGLWVTNAAMYFSRMDLTPKSVRAYYLGDASEYSSPKSAAALLEVSHAHLATMGVMILLLTHLALFAPWEDRRKKLLVAASFGSALLGEASGWLVRFVSPAFAPLKVAAFVLFQTALGVLVLGLASFLYAASRAGRRRAPSA